MPTIVNYEPPSFNLQIPKRMLTRSERDQVLRNHMTATNTTFNKVAVLEDLMQQEPHNAALYKEVQHVQKNQHIQVAIKLQHMLEADDEFRQTAGLPQLDLPEHLWTVRNMDTAPIREQHFMAISSEVEVLRQQLKVKGMYPVPPNYMQINQQNIHFQPIQPAKLSPLQPQDRLFFDPLLSTTTGSTGSQSDNTHNPTQDCSSAPPKVHTPSPRIPEPTIPPTPYVNQAAVEQHMRMQSPSVPPTNITTVAPPPRESPKASVAQETLITLATSQTTPPQAQNQLTTSPQRPRTSKSKDGRGIKQSKNVNATTKEAYAIYVAVKKLSFYLTDAEVLLKSDHLPLKKFLQKNTLNNKVNNWAMELEAFNIKFQHVSGKTNILADTLSSLVDIDPDARLDPENAGWEFGYYIFETLPKLSSEEIASVCEVLSGTNIILPDPDLQEPFTQVLTSPLTNDQLQSLQAQDEKCTSLTAMLRRGKLDPLVYSMNDGVLHRRVIEGGQTFQAIYVPRMPPGLIESILKAAHDDSGHNGFPRTYSAIRRLYYWKGIKEDVRQHCTNCYTCQLHRTAAVKFEAKHFKPGIRPMDFIAMDLIGEFHPPSSQGNRYALTGICMLTGFTWCIPLKSKKAAEVSRAYLQHVYSVLGGSTKILTDNGTEFKNEVFKEMLQKLDTEKLIHSPPYRPQSNGRIEGFHRYLKACMAKYMRAGLEWDEVTAMATAAYNYFPNMSAKESAFFLMYGRDPLNKLSAILNAPRRYLGDATGFPDLEALKNMYQMVAQQLMNSRERYVKSNKYNKIPDHGILVGDLVLMKDHTAKSFQPKYKEDFCVVQVYGTNALQVHNVHITDVRKINMTEKIAAQLQEAYNNKGRTAKHLIPQGRIPDLGWNTDQQGKERQKLPNTTPEAPVTQTMPQQAEGPPSSQLRSKSKTTTLMDPQNHNAKTMDQHNALPQVNQVHTVRKAGFGWQTVVALTIIVNFIITLFLCFRM